MKQLYLNQCTLLSLFDTYVCNILNYSWEVLSSHKGPDIEKVHLEFLQYVLGFRKNTNTFIIYFETGRRYWIRLYKFWFKIMQSENCISRASYECLYRMCENSKKYCSSWVSFINKQLSCLGFGYIWNAPNCINSHVCLQITRQRLKDHFIQNLWSKIKCRSKLFSWQLLFRILLRKSTFIPKLYKKMYYQN